MKYLFLFLILLIACDSNKDSQNQNSPIFEEEDIVNSILKIVNQETDLSKNSIKFIIIMPNGESTLYAKHEKVNGFEIKKTIFKLRYPLENSKVICSDIVETRSSNFDVNPGEALDLLPVSDKVMDLDDRGTWMFEMVSEGLLTRKKGRFLEIKEMDEIIEKIFNLDHHNSC